MHILHHHQQPYYQPHHRHGDFVSVRRRHHDVATNPRRHLSRYSAGIPMQFACRNRRTSTTTQSMQSRLHSTLASPAIFTFCGKTYSRWSCVIEESQQSIGFVTILCGFVTLTFDLSTSNLHYQSLVTLPPLLISLKL